MSRVLDLVDRWFRAWGILALTALAVTALSLASGRGAWRVPFVLAHLAALLALLPLGSVLVVRVLAEAYRVAGSPVGALVEVARRYRTVLVLLAVVAVTVPLSIANQGEGGTRWLRAPANLTTVAIVLVLVVRYLRDAATRRTRAVSRPASPAAPAAGTGTGR